MQLEVEYKNATKNGTKFIVGEQSIAELTILHLPGQTFSVRNPICGCNPLKIKKKVSKDSASVSKIVKNFARAPIYYISDSANKNIIVVDASAFPPL